MVTEWKTCVKFPDAEQTDPISFHFDRIKECESFVEIIQALSEIPDEAQGTQDDGIVKEIDGKWKYEIIRQIGAPWTWIYQFVDHHLPYSRSYNFYECQHKLASAESLEHLILPNYTVFDMTAAGPTIPNEITNEFLKFIKMNAHKNDGMVSPKYFRDENCPRMC